MIADTRTRGRELTARECAVLRGIERGDSMKTIAFDLGISVPSVKTFSRRGIRKLGAIDAYEAVRRHRLLKGHECLE